MGTYLALKARKSDIYTTPNGDACVLVLVVRAALGKLHLTKEAMTRTTMPAERRDGRGPQSSVVALTAAYEHSSGDSKEHAGAYTCPDDREREL